MLTLKPAGRGNWKPVIVTLEGDRAVPLMFPVGTKLVLGGVIFRICSVTA